MHRLRDESYSEDLLELHEENRAASPADLVSVVRCKDCEHWWSAITSNHLIRDGREWEYCHKNSIMKPEDGFCHEGERRA